jgi:hypothetical protein
MGTREVSPAGTVEGNVPRSWLTMRPKAAVLRAIGAVASGEALFDPSIGRWLMGFFGTGRASMALPTFPKLTER